MRWPERLTLNKKASVTMGLASIQSLINLFSFPSVLLRRVDSSGKLYQPLNPGKGGSSFGTSVWEGTGKIFTFCGFLALEIIVVVFLFCNRGALNLRRCQFLSPEPRFPPSAWYDEHVYEYPRPVLKILTSEDGAPAIHSRMMPREREITIATHTTADRLPAVKMTALRWSGAMALVVLVRVRSEVPTVYADLQELHAIVEGEERCRLSIQVVLEDGFKDDDEALTALYPINSMRNLALRMVTTTLVFMIDADMVPNPGLHEHLTNDEDKYFDYVQKVTEGHHVLVIPAFHMNQDKSIPYRESLHALPHTLEEMREAWWNGILDCFQCDVSLVSHSPTDYPRFIDPAVDYPYEVTYTEGYEPFFLAATIHFPTYDTRFRGYAKNKSSHAYLLAAKGVRFTVIQEGFLVELPHLPSHSQRVYWENQKDTLQKWRIDALYSRFKAEVTKELKETEFLAERHNPDA